MIVGTASTISPEDVRKLELLGLTFKAGWQRVEQREKEIT